MAKKQASPVAHYRRPSLQSGARRRVTFDLPPRTLDMLRDEADRRGMSQVYLLERLILNNCDPKREPDEHERAF